jgi:hypothetical protein
MTDVVEATGMDIDIDIDGDEGEGGGCCCDAPHSALASAPTIVLIV